jgi:hypothetical protein
MPYKNPNSSAQPSHQEGSESSHSMAFHYNPLNNELRIPKVGVCKFDGLDAAGWVTRMEHYFPLHGITDDLAKICIGAFIWITNIANGVKIHTEGIFLRPILLHIFLNSLTLTHHLIHLTKMKLSGTLEEYIDSFEKLAF